MRSIFYNEKNWDKVHVPICTTVHSMAKILMAGLVLQHLSKTVKAVRLV